MKVDDIRSIAIVGAGLMGHAMAQEFALAGYEVHTMLIRLTHTTLDFVLTPAKCRRSSDMLSVTTS